METVVPGIGSFSSRRAKDGLNAGDQRFGSLGWYGRRRNSIQKPVVSAVHQKA
jgi:hypothetical protein